MGIHWKRALFYLGINVLVSACTTWGVLMLWGRAYLPPPPPTPAVAQGLPAASPTATPPRFVYTVRQGDTLAAIAERFHVDPATLQALNHLDPETPLAVGQALLIPGMPPTATAVALPQGALIIQNVLGAGTLEDERVIIAYQGNGSLNLQGWQLEDGRGHTYTFPSLSLQSGGAVQVWTKGGLHDTVVDLYWGLDQAIWHSGSTVALKNPQGQTAATYTIP